MARARRRLGGQARIDAARENDDTVEFAEPPPKKAPAKKTPPVKKAPGRPRKQT